MQFQDGHSFYGRILWSSVRLDTQRPSPIDPLFLSQHSNFAFQLVNPCLLDGAFLVQGFATSEHGDACYADDVQHGVANGG